MDDAGESVPVERVPDKFRNIFANYLCFNKIQSAVFNDAFETDASLVVSAPTGAGKTVIFELAICRLLRKYDLHQMEYDFKIVYVAPIKALCEERVLDWHKKFSSLGLNCISVTGDTDVISIQHLSNHNFIVTTPEKWDSLTRRWRSSLSVINRVALFMIDEVHLLNDEQRGPTLEAIMSRMKTIEDFKKESLSAEMLQTIRFLAISATIPNVQDIAEWIGSRALPAKYFNFSDEVRPVKLNKIVLGYYYNPQMSTPFKFDILLSYKLQSIILQYSNGKPTLIFCSTRKSVEMTTRHLSQHLTIQLTGSQRAILQQAAAEITTPAIKEILIHGVGSHHAGMLPDSRRIMETLFRNGDLPILVTTSTLAMGINLPAHLVIIKSTKYYAKSEYRDYSESVLFQMIGRAGRPQFDTFATAVILTTSMDKEKFDNMLGGTQNVESSLHKHLTEHLNAEIVLRTITDREVSKHWLNSTFLHIRARKHPTYYGFSANLNQEQLDRKLMEMCEIEINKLERVGMIQIESEVITPTYTGSLMAKYCVHFDTMKLFKEVQGTEVLQQILSLISKSHEFSDNFLRVNDKKTLNLLNKCKNRETIRFPFNGKIKTVHMKINCIIQAVFGCLQIVEPSLLNEAQKIMKIGERLSNCLADFVKERGHGFSALLSALTLAKCFHCRIWENSPHVSRQLSGIGAVMSGHLVAAGKTSFQSISETNPRNLEMILHRKPPMGDTIIRAVELLPQYVMSLEEVKLSSKKSQVKIVIKLMNSQKLQNQLTIDADSCMDLVIGDNDNNILLHEKISHNFMIDNKEIEKLITNEFTQPTTIMGHFISENFAGIDCEVTLEMNTAILCNKNTKQSNCTQKKAATKTKQKPVKKSEQPIVVKGTEKPVVKNFINEYFKIVKKIQTPVMSPILNSVKAELDEINLLESEQDDFNNWEPLDEKLLDSSDEHRIDNYINECENDQLTNNDKPIINKNAELGNNTLNSCNIESNSSAGNNNNTRRNSVTNNDFETEDSKTVIKIPGSISDITNISHNKLSNADSGFATKELTLDMLNDDFEKEFSREFFTQDALKSEGSQTPEPRSKRRKFQFKKRSNKENALKHIDSFEDVFSDDLVGELKLAQEGHKSQEIAKSDNINVLSDIKMQQAAKVISHSKCGDKKQLPQDSVKMSEKGDEKSSAARIIEQLNCIIANKKSSTSDLNDEGIKYSESESINSVSERIEIDDCDVPFMENSEQMNQYEEAMKRMKEYEEGNNAIENTKCTIGSKCNVNDSITIDHMPSVNNAVFSKPEVSVPVMNQRCNDDLEAIPEYEEEELRSDILGSDEMCDEEEIVPAVEYHEEQVNHRIVPANIKRSTNERMIYPEVDRRPLENVYANKQGNFSRSESQSSFQLKYNDGIFPSRETMLRRSNSINPAMLQRSTGQENIQSSIKPMRTSRIIPQHIQTDFNNVSDGYSNYNRSINNPVGFLEESKCSFTDVPKMNQFIDNRQIPGNFAGHCSPPNRYVMNQRNPNIITCEAESSNMVFGNELSSLSDGDEEECVPIKPGRIESFISDVSDLSASCSNSNRSHLGKQSIRARSARGNGYSGGDARMRNADPASESFSNMFKKRKKKSLAESAMDFETSVIEDIRNYSYEPKKKISHTVTSNSSREENERGVVQKRAKPSAINDYSQAGSSKKSIKWGSPLIVSPKYKYSPKNIQKINIFPNRPEINSTSDIQLAQPRRMVATQPTRISFAQNPFNVNPPSTSHSQSLYNQQTRPKVARRRPIFGALSLNTPKNLQPLPVTDQDCGYNQSTQHVEVTQRRCEELNKFFCKPSMEIFKPDTNFVQHDISNYVRQNQPSLPLKQDDDGQDWWNRSISSEHQVNEQLQRDISEIIEINNMPPYEEMPYLNQSQGSCCNQCNFNYQPAHNAHMHHHQPPYYSREFELDYNTPHLNYEQQMRWGPVGRRRPLPQNPERTGYNTENRSDLMQRYLQTQAQEKRFKDK